MGTLAFQNMHYQHLWNAIASCFLVGSMSWWSLCSVLNAFGGLATLLFMTFLHEGFVWKDWREVSVGVLGILLVVQSWWWQANEGCFAPFQSEVCIMKAGVPFVSVLSA